ncbi:S1C family serine protease [Streptomyces echinatus]|uniref:S1-C subfamily serine protease n=1 Tax=Streptomyces echinatus TaxID=67293 RepID=A0A7W9PRK0_9ACTN|nr:S1C family serine protease [Streptomyces echinatus]MBB5926546.1 S1-C subfamily serine protease [Streptomyces echinatus]
MSAKINLLAVSAVLIATCGSTAAAAGEPSPGDPDQAKDAVVQVLSDSASGTGFVYDASRGLVVTTASLIAGESRLDVIIPGKRQSVPAQLLGSDLCQDLAVLELISPQQGLKDLRLGDSDQVDAGDPITSLGYPSAGSDTGADVVAAAGEAKTETDVENGAPSSPDYPSVIYHSAEVKDGATGGPVLNSDGEVIGVNTGVFIEQDAGTGEKHRSSSVAIASNHAKSKLPGLVAGDMKNDPGWWLGAVSDPVLPKNAAAVGIPEGSVQNAQKRLQDQGVDGLFLLDFRKNSPASSANLHQGAVITAVNGVEVSSVSELCDVLEPASAGDNLQLKGVYTGVGSAGHKFGGSWTAELNLEGDS